MSNNLIQKDWENLKLSDIGKIISGGTPSTSIPEYWGGDINWVSPADLTGYTNKYIARGAKSISEEGLKNSSAKLMPKGSVLFSSRAPIGYVAIADSELSTNQGFKSIIPNDKIDKEYLYYFLKASKQRAEQVASGTTFKEISLAKFSELTIPVPPLMAQRVIVSKIEELFSELDKGIENLRLAQQQLKTYRQSVLKWAFEGKLTASKEVPSIGLEQLSMVAEDQKEYGEKLPKGWKHVSITEITEKDKHSLKAGPFGSSLKKEFYVQNGYKIYGQEQVISGDPFYGDYYISKEKYEELFSCRVKPSDLLISLVGTVGKVLLLPPNCEPGIINPRLVKVSLNTKLYLPKFFKHYFESSTVKGFYSGETRGTTMDVLNLGIIKTIPFPICSLDEQKKVIEEIESRLSVADKMEESISQSLQQAEALRQSILKKAFEGKLVATDIIETIKQTAKVVPFERKVLAGKIIHLLHHDENFGLTKFQKIFYLVENFAQVPYETNFIRERAGPYDKEFTIAFRKEMQEKDWIQEDQHGSITKFTLRENIGSLISKYPAYFRDKGKDIIFVLKQLKGKSTHDAELIATLYAVWNNRLIKKKPVKVELLVEDFFNWSSKKSEEFLEQEVREMYKLMKEIKLMPKGFGKYIEPLNIR